MNRRSLPGSPHFEYYLEAEGTYAIENIRTGEAWRGLTKRQFSEHVARIVQQSEYLPLGDAFARLTHALGIRECEPCRKRRARLNAAIKRPKFLRRRRS